MVFSAFGRSSGTTRSFTRFSQALDEVIDSRVWGGILAHRRRGERADRHADRELGKQQVLQADLPLTAAHMGQQARLRTA